MKKVANTSLAQIAPKGKAERTLREARIVTADEYGGFAVDATRTRQLAPLGLTHVCELRQNEVATNAPATAAFPLPSPVSGDRREP